MSPSRARALMPKVSLDNQPWRRLAECRAHQGLPWTADDEPEGIERRAMEAVCADCPVFADCGRHALLADEPGGWWAGGWIPWQTTADERNRRFSWEKARAMLMGRLAVMSPHRESPSS